MTTTEFAAKVATDYAAGHAHATQTLAVGDTGEANDIRDYLTAAGPFPPARITWFAQGLRDGLGGTRNRMLGA
ncbi:hypothetical protein [Gordonia sp. NPDC003376]